MNEMPEITTYHTSTSDYIPGAGNNFTVGRINLNSGINPNRDNFMLNLNKYNYYDNGTVITLPKEMLMNQKRIVEIYVVDPNKNVAVEDSIIIHKDRCMTDQTDEELYFGLNIKDLVDKHNEKRIKIIDKDKSDKFGKEMYLDPIRISELKMTVVVIAIF